MPTARPIVIVTTGDPVPDVRARRGEFADLIRESVGQAWSGGYHAFDARGDAYPMPDGVAAFIITGSSANVPHREPWMLRVEGWLREAVALGTPVLGICFGHQLLGQALGGDVQRNPRGREIGTLPIERLADDPLFDGFPPGRFHANVTHVDSVVRLPRGAVPLARSEREDHHVIRFAPRCYGVQFHPEIDADVMRGYLDARRPVLVDEQIDVDALQGAVTDAPTGRLALVNFVRHVMPGGA